MTEHDEQDEGGGADAPRSDSIERDDGVRRLLKSAMGEEPPQVDVLAGVQKRLRERSGGKFYADRWATSRQPPVATYLVTSLIMLAVVLTIYLVLAPLRGAARAIDAVPAPVQIVPGPIRGPSEPARR
jgi:hypothetical protein